MLHMLRLVRSTLDKSAPPAWRRCPEQAAPGCRMSSLPPCFWGCGCVPATGRLQVDSFRCANFCGHREAELRHFTAANNQSSEVCRTLRHARSPTSCAYERSICESLTCCSAAACCVGSSRRSRSARVECQRLINQRIKRRRALVQHLLLSTSKRAPDVLADAPWSWAYDRVAVGKRDGAAPEMWTGNADQEAAAEAEVHSRQRSSPRHV